jgi:hypothetical protein
MSQEKSQGSVAKEKEPWKEVEGDGSTDHFIHVCQVAGTWWLNQPNQILVELPQVCLTSTESIWLAFRGNLPSRELHQSWNCILCTKTVHEFGHLGIYDQKEKTLRSALFPFSSKDQLPLILQQKYGSSCHYVQQCLNRVTQMKEIQPKAFVPSTVNLGTHESGGYKHLHIRIPKHLVPETMSVSLWFVKPQREPLLIKENTLDFDTRLRMFQGILRECDEKLMGQMAALFDIKTNECATKMDQGRDFAPIVKYWNDVFSHKDNNSQHKDLEKESWIISESRKAPLTFLYHLRYGVLGALLKDLKGYPIASATSTTTSTITTSPLSQLVVKWNQHVNSNQFKRIPTAEYLALSEQVLSDLKIDSLSKLERRLIYDLEPFTSQFKYVWKSKENNEPDAKQKDANIKTTKITWKHFQNNILPKANKVEVQVPIHNFNLCTLLVSDPTYPITKYHPVSWFYPSNKSYTAQEWHLFPEQSSCKSAINNEKDRFVKVDSIFPFPHLWQTTYKNHETRERMFMHIRGAFNTRCNPCDYSKWGIFGEDLIPSLFSYRKKIEQLSRESSTYLEPNKIPITGFEISDDGNNGVDATTSLFRVQMNDAGSIGLFSVQLWS